MDPKIQQQLDDLEIKISEIHTATKKTEKYMKFTFWTTIVVVVGPILIAAVVLPVVINSYLSALNGII